MQRANEMFLQATSSVGTARSKKNLTWVCVKGEIGALSERFGSATFVRKGCGVIEPLETLPGRFIRKACPCESVFRDECRKQQEIEEWHRTRAPLTFGWLGHRYGNLTLAEKTFENFDRSRQPEAWDNVKMFAGTLYGTLILHGPYGTGKTHLLAAVCNQVLRQMKSARFIIAPKFFGAIQAKISENEDYQPILQQAITTPLLVLDDIDKCKYSEFREEIYFAIIDERVNAGRPIAISTNRFGDLEKYIGGACADRLCIGMTEIEMDGSSYRREMM